MGHHLQCYERMNTYVQGNTICGRETGAEKRVLQFIAGSGRGKYFTKGLILNNNWMIELKGLVLWTEGWMKCVTRASFAWNVSFVMAVWSCVVYLNESGFFHIFFFQSTFYIIKYLLILVTKRLYYYSKSVRKHFS